ARRCGLDSRAFAATEGRTNQRRSRRCGVQEATQQCRALLIVGQLIEGEVGGSGRVRGDLQDPRVHLAALWGERVGDRAPRVPGRHQIRCAPGSEGRVIEGEIMALLMRVGIWTAVRLRKENTILGSEPVAVQGAEPVDIARNTGCIRGRTYILD